MWGWKLLLNANIASRELEKSVTVSASCSIVAQMAPCCLMNNPMKADELNPSGKLYLFHHWFNNAKGVPSLCMEYKLKLAKALIQQTSCMS